MSSLDPNSNKAIGATLTSASAEAHCEELTHTNWRVRLSAAEALAELGDLRAFEPLCKMLEDYDPTVRTSAAKALGILGDARAVDPLCLVFKEEYYNVRYEAAIALGKIGGTQAVEFLCLGLTDGNRETRRYLTQALAAIRGDVRVITVLCTALQDTDEHVCAYAAWALGEISDLRAVEPLIMAFQKKDMIFREQVARSLWKIGNVTTLPLRILSATILGPAQKLDALQNLSRFSHTVHYRGGRTVFCYPIGNIQIFCENLCRQVDIEESVRDGTKAVLAELQNRVNASVLLRASTCNEPGEATELLRGTTGQFASTPPEELLRPSETSSEQKSPRKPGILSRLFKRN